MAFLGVKELNKLQQEKQIISPFEGYRVKNGAYELSLGTEVYLTDAKTGKVELLDESKNRQVDINPGQFALLLTREKVNVPKDKIGFISIKAGEKLKGLVNVSGFHVDPGFNDHLIFSVYNAGPSTIVLNFGEPYFPIWFAEMKDELDKDEAYSSDNEHFGKLSHIPPKYIEFLKRGDLTSPKALFDKIKEVETSLEGKILKSDEKKERIDWLFKAIITLVVAIFLKVVIWDWVAYDKGYIDGKNSKEIEEKIREKVHGKLVDSIVYNKIDSILKTRTKDDDTTK